MFRRSRLLETEITESLIAAARRAAAHRHRRDDRREWRQPYSLNLTASRGGKFARCKWGTNKYQ